MRRILRKVVAGEADQLGDLSSIADPSVVDDSEELLADTRSRLTKLPSQSSPRSEASKARSENRLNSKCQE